MRVAEVIRDLACQLQALMRIVAAQQDLSTTQAQILFSIPSDGISMSQLAGRLGLDASTMSRVIGIMLKRGWVEQEKSNADRRITLVSLSPSGTELYDLLREDLESRMSRTLVDLSTDQQHAIEGPLEELAWLLAKDRL